MDMLVVGASGLLGSSVVRTALDRDFEVSGTYYTNKPSFDIDLFEADIRGLERIEQVIEINDPDFVVNCAALTDVDECEVNPDKAEAINAIGAKYIAEITAERDIQLIHSSTDYVFDGKQDDRYSELSPPNPVQVYGRSKLEGEENVIRTHQDPLIIRVSFVYGRHGASRELDGFPAWITKKIYNNEEINLFTNQCVTPTRAGYAAEIICRLAKIAVDVPDVLHVASKSCITPYEFGKEIVDILNKDPALIEKQDMKELNRPAERPVNTCLSTKCVDELLGEQSPSFRADLRRILSS